MWPEIVNPTGLVAVIALPQFMVSVRRTPSGTW